VDAADWYDGRRSGLGVDFTTVVHDAIDDIVVDPLRFAPVDSALSYYQIRRFPYVILFSANSDRTLILSVLHAARSPDKWKERRVDDFS